MNKQKINRGKKKLSGRRRSLRDRRGIKAKTKVKLHIKNVHMNNFE